MPGKLPTRHPPGDEWDVLPALVGTQICPLDPREAWSGQFSGNDDAGLWPNPSGSTPLWGSESN
jgi:hypothetical protein